MQTHTNKAAIDLEGVLRVDEMAGLFKTSPHSIRRAVRRGTFPIPPLEGINSRLRWWGPAVRVWLDAQVRNARDTFDDGGPPRRRRLEGAHHG